MHTQARSRALPCCMMARKDNQRLELCVYNVQLVNQSAVPDNLVREACQRPHYRVNFVQSRYILAGPKICPLYGIVRCLHFGEL